MSAPAPGTLVAGRFEVLGELGRGGFGVVLEAHDRELARRVALKFFRQVRLPVSADAPHFAEAEAIARLSHPNIVQIFDRGRCDAGPFLVLERLDGEPLSRRLERGPLAPMEVAHLGLAIARGMAHAHARGVVHGDLKPANVFLCAGGEVKVLDFGLAQLIGVPGHAGGGTPGWTAPEAQRGEPADERTDVWSIGAVLHRSLGALDASSPTPDQPAAPGLGRAITAMLAPDRTDRPRDASHAVRLLETVLRRAEQRTRNRGPSAPLLPGLVLAVVVAAGAAWWNQPRAFPPPPPGPAPLVTIVLARWAAVPPVAADEGRALQRLIRQKLEGYLAGDPRISVALDDRVPESEPVAQGIGRQARAAVVGWGELVSLGGVVRPQAWTTLCLSPAVEPERWDTLRLAEVRNVRATEPIELEPEGTRTELPGSGPAQQADRIARALLRRAVVVHADSSLALAVLDRVTPPDPRTQAVKAGLLLQVGRLQEARELAERALETWASSRELLVQAISARLMQGLDPAGHVDRLAVLEPALAAYHRAKARFLFHPDEAVPAVQEALAQAPGDPSVHVLAAHLQAEVGTPAQVVAELRMAERVARPEDVLWVVGWAWCRAGDYGLPGGLEEAARVAGEAIAARPEDGRLVAFAASLLQRLGRHDEAERAIRRALAGADPIEAEPLRLALAQVLGSAGRHREAIAEVRGLSLAALQARRLPLLGALTRALRAAGRHEEAVREWQQAREDMPEEGELVLALGRELAHGGRLEEAARLLERAAEQDAGAEVRLLLARTRLEQGRSQEALRVLDSLSPEDADGLLLWSLRSSAFRQLGHIEQARSAAGQIYLDRAWPYPQMQKFLLLARLGPPGVRLDTSSLAALSERLRLRSLYQRLTAPRETGAPPPPIRSALDAYFFGMVHLLGLEQAQVDSSRADPEEARRLLKVAAADPDMPYLAYDLARVELAALERP